LSDAVTAEIRKVLCKERDAEALLREVADMRARIDKERGTEEVWNVKYLRGGLIDIEFIAQYLQLLHAHANSAVLSANTATALRNLAEAGALAPEIADQLLSALSLWQRIQGYLRLTVEGAFSPAEASEALLSGLCRAAFPDEETELAMDVVEQRLRATAAACHRIFRDLIEDPAGQLPAME
jgi:glutamate-ammonia-ligase adenylyltransferase